MAEQDMGAKPLYNTTRNPGSSARRLKVHTPADVVDISPAPRGLQIEGADGTVTTTDSAGDTVIITVTQGQWVPYSPTRVTAVSAGVVVHLVY